MQIHDLANYVTIMYNMIIMWRKRSGTSNFDNCSLKRVQYVEWMEVMRGDETLNISTKAFKSGDTVLKSTGVKPILTCPKLTELGVDVRSDKERRAWGYDTRAEALQNIRKIAGLTVCASCEFVGMSAVDVANRRRATAEAEQRALIAEANLKALQSKVANGEAIIQDLPPEGGLYPRT